MLGDAGLGSEVMASLGILLGTSFASWLAMASLKGTGRDIPMLMSRRVMAATVVDVQRGCWRLQWLLLAEVSTGGLKGVVSACWVLSS